MCTGAEMALISAAASGGGAAINTRIQNQAIAEANRQNKIRMDIERKARGEETERQAAMERTSAEEVTQALLGADPAAVAETVAAQAVDPTNPIIQAAAIHNVPVFRVRFKT